MRWLSGKTHVLKDFPVWAPPEDKLRNRSIGRILDTLHEKLGEIIMFPSFILSE